jgi:predicted exporter
VNLSARWALGVWFAFVLACGWIISRTEFSTDMSAFLPRAPSPAQQVLVEQLRDGVVSRLILIGLEGGTPATLAQTSKRLAAQLRKAPDFISVNNGETVGAEKDRDFLWRNRYLLSPAISAEHFSAAGLRNALEDNLQLLGSPAGALVKHILADDPSGELIRLIDQLEGQSKPAMRDGVWFAKDGKRALLVAQTTAPGYDIDAQQRALLLIQRAFAQASSVDSAAPPHLLVSGPGVFSVRARDSIKGDAMRISLIATTLVALMLLALYRSPRVLVLGLLPVASGALAGVAAVSLGFGSVHGITLGFGATLIGEGVDYAIYLFTQITPARTPQATLARIWPTLRLGVLTSICGFSAMLFSGFQGLAQLGLFSIAGLIVAVAVTRWVLPVLLPRGFTAQMVSAFAPRVMSWVQRAPRLRYLALLVVVLAVASIVAHRSPIWNEQLGSLSPISKQDQLLDEQLRRDIGAPDVRYLIVINAPDQERTLQASEKIGALLQPLVQQSALQSFDSPALYLPSQATQRARQATLPASDVLRENLQQALSGLPFRADLFEPFLRNVAAAKTQPLQDRRNLQGTNLALKLDSLLVKRTQGWAAMLPLRGVTQPEVIAAEIAKLPGQQTVLLDIQRESQRLYQTYLEDAIMLSLLGAIAIVVLLAASLRSPRRVLRVLLPLAAAVITVTGVLTLGDHQLTIFHLVGLLLVVAIGSNYALFFDRQGDAGHDRERMLTSLLFANLSTVIGFGLLSFSHAPVLQAIGITVGVGAILSLVFSAMLIVPSAPEKTGLDRALVR